MPSSQEEFLTARLLLQGLLLQGHLGVAAQLKSLIPSCDSSALVLRTRLRKAQFNQLEEQLGSDPRALKALRKFRILKALREGREQEALCIFKASPNLDEDIGRYFLIDDTKHLTLQQLEQQCYMNLLGLACPQDYTDLARLDKLLKTSLAESASSCEFHNSLTAHLPLGKNLTCPRPFTKYQRRNMVQSAEVRNQIWHVRLSFDDEQVAIATKAMRVDVYRVEGLRLLASRQLHSQDIICLEWSRRGHLLSASKMCAIIQSSAVRVTDNRLNVLYSLVVQGKLVSAVFFRQGVLTSNKEKEVLLWNSTGSVETRMKVKAPVLLQAAEPNLVTLDSENRVVTVVDFDRQTEVSRIEEEQEITQLTVSRDCQFLFYSVSELRNEIKMWHLPTCRLLNRFPFTRSKNTVLWLSLGGPADSLLAAGSEHGQVFVYHVRRPEPVATFSNGEQTVNQARPTKDGRWILVGSDSGELSLWEGVSAAE